MSTALPESTSPQRRVGDDERLARLALARVVEPGSHAMHGALRRRPAVEVWAALRAGAPLEALGQRGLDGVRGRLDGYEPMRDLERLHDVGGRVVCPGDDEWPHGLVWEPGALAGNVRQMAPPWVLFVRGPAPLGASAASSVAVVGARAATAYGAQVAQDLSFALCEVGVAVVSGGAYGIDGAAHRGALAAEAAPTIAVLAGGVDVAYPRGHDRLLARIAAEGALVSEVPPGSSPTRVRFLVRNRLIAALSQGTVVVEASRRSGSLSTAGRAADLGRHVMAVPGAVSSGLSLGCHDLIRDGAAVLVTGAADVLELLGAAGEHLLPVRCGPSDPRDGLDETVRRVLDAVPVRTPVGVASIARTAGVSALVVSQVLPGLLVTGLVEQRDGAWLLTSLGAGRPAPRAG